MTKINYNNYVEHPRFGKGPRFTGLDEESSHWHRDRIPFTAIAGDLTKQAYTTFPITHYYDCDRTCRRCTQPFIFFAEEQKYWYEELQLPCEANAVHCYKCRRDIRTYKNLMARYAQLTHTAQSAGEIYEMAKAALVLVEEGIFLHKVLEKITHRLRSIPPEEIDECQITILQTRIKDLRKKTNVQDSILTAISIFDAPGLKALLLEHGPLTFRGNSSKIPLHLAVELEALECLKELLAFPIEISQQDSEGRTALFYSKTLEITTALVEAGIEISQQDSEGRTALFYSNTPEIATALVGAGINIYSRDAFGKNALEFFLGKTSWYCEKHVEKVLAICDRLLELGLPMHFKSSHGKGENQLHILVSAGELNQLKFIIRHGHPVDNESLFYIQWMRARDTNRNKILKELLNHGANPNVHNYFGDTPLHLALNENKLNLIGAKLLLNAGADINSVNNNGFTPLHLIYKLPHSYVPVIKFLLERGANPLIPNSKGKTVIDTARDHLSEKSDNPSESIKLEILALLESAAQRFR